MIKGTVGRLLFLFAVPAHCATEHRSQGTIRLWRIFGIGDASPNADDA